MIHDADNEAGEFEYQEARRFQDDITVRLPELRAAFGHADLGVYAEVLEGGRIGMGDAIELV